MGRDAWGVSNPIRYLCFEMLTDFGGLCIQKIAAKFLSHPAPLLGIGAPDSLVGGGDRLNVT